MKRLPPMFRSLIHAVLPLFLIVVVPDRGSGQGGLGVCSGDAPCNLTATAVSASEITVTWLGEPLSGAAHKIQWTTGTTPTWPTPGTNEIEVAEGILTYSHTNLTADTQYWYRLQACAP